ncbi:16S rRNA (cytosine967-C5)-methyltransferase [Rhodoligotrophos appendicifer]|uniref:RsmB/NOP family class I SAM-dependent RNA methyltransferase n=1 Tax=Rhodoligotrophos appendicifer TaxID=987056 RepID=UPI001186395C|nr:transcription antitermination factor NusB [Rhodoligotrophos appendicifer]
MTSLQPSSRSKLPGLPVRREAARLLVSVLRDRQPLDDLLQQSAASGPLSKLEPRDRAMVRAIVATSLRRKGQIDAALGQHLTKPLPKRQDLVQAILLSGAAQVLFMGVAAHAAIDTAVSLTDETKPSRHLKGLVNAVLRRVAVAGPSADVQLNVPAWLRQRWVQAYGETIATAIGEAHLHEASLDLSCRDDRTIEEIATRLGATILPTGTLRRDDIHGRVEELPGFADGSWWVQDAAAALPARLIRDAERKVVIDLCAAPGGKTLQLAARGARVTAVDISEKRLRKVRDNLTRTGLAAEIICADATTFTPVEPVDAVLLDAPCSATGTIRRHPDIPYTKTAEQIAELSHLQRTLLEHALTMLKPGGELVYCSCSLEPLEGEELIETALREGLAATRSPIGPEEVGGLTALITAKGEVRTLPCQVLDQDRGIVGLDGFYACRLIKS